MVNSTQLSTNMTVYNSMTLANGRLIYFTTILPFFCIFAYFMTGIVNAYFTVPRIQENPRYILFIHMLINDVVHLFFSFFLFACSLYYVYLPFTICYTVLTVTASTFRITPYNLAVMSLERYAAICHPLQHAQLCTIKRSGATIALMWTVALIPQVADFIAFCSSVQREVFLLNINCQWQFLLLNEAQDILRTLTIVMSFTAVGLIIVYTYFKVMLMARRINTGKSASKAGKTILLHAFQLLLCMLSLTTPYIDKYLYPIFHYGPIINLILFMCLPRFISPLVYGIRDEVLGKYMRNVCFSGSSISVR